MATEEIDKFVRKFKDLWNSGFDAHLDVDAHAGEAWVGLRVRVGRAPGVLHPKSEGYCPARERRRVRRAAARNEQSDRNVKEEPEESDESIATEEVAVRIDETVQLTQENNDVDDKFTTEEVAKKIEPICQESKTEIMEEDENVEENAVTEEVADQNSEEIVIEDNLVEDATEEKAKAKDNEVKIIEKEPEIVVVHATAVIANSPGQRLTEVDTTNLQNLIFRENHLQQNIVKLEFGQQYSDSRNNLFKHTLELKLLVATQRLWEGPRSYIWKHMGQNEWAKENGSTVVFNRIHVKT